MKFLFARSAHPDEGVYVQLRCVVCNDCICGPVVHDLVERGRVPGVRLREGEFGACQGYSEQAVFRFARLLPKHMVDLSKFSDRGNVVVGGAA